jgi:hypothetical protein
MLDLRIVWLLCDEEVGVVREVARELIEPADLAPG